MHKAGLIFGACCLLQSLFATPSSAQQLRGMRGIKRATSCTFTDVSKIVSSKAACSTIILDSIAVPAGETLDLTGLSTGTTVIFQGSTTFGYEEWAGPLVSVSGTQITVTSAPGAILDGNGARWWDGKGSNGGKTKPKFFAAHKLQQSTISNIHVKNSPVQVFSVNGVSDLEMLDITIDNLAGDTLGAHNTDAFDVGSSDNVRIIGARVLNQDDCLAINSGSNIVFTHGICSGGHGLSIGSLGGGNTVSNVVISNNVIHNSDNGVRIKTIFGQTGTVNNVTYSHITLSSIRKFGIVIEQDYENGSPTGTPSNGIPITGLTLHNIHGSVVDSGVNTYILCGSGTCSDWQVGEVNVIGGQKVTQCANTPSGISC